MAQSATAGLPWTLHFRVGTGFIQSTPATNKAIAKSSKTPIKMRARGMPKDANNGYFANKATQLIENRRPDFYLEEQTHCENGKNPVKMRVRTHRNKKRILFLKFSTG